MFPFGGAYRQPEARRVASVSRWRDWLQDDCHRTILVLAGWTILHNLSYMVFLPVPGTASRYGAVNHLVLWVALVAGLRTFVPRRRWLVALAGLLISTAVANTLYWNGVYDANLYHMANVRLRAARFLDRTFPMQDLCAAFDVGALRYFSGRSILDLGGLIDPDAPRVFAAGAADRYLLDHKARCLILPGRSGRPEEGWFDFADILGLAASRLLHLQPAAAFKIDGASWLRGYLPTVNYQASVVVYRIEPGPSDGP